MEAMSEDTFVEAEIWSVARTNQGNAILIRPIGADVAVPIFIGPLETQSIVIGLGGVQVPRPLTHDLLVTLAANCGRKPSRVEISDLKEGTFYARIVLEGPSGEETLDSRPSDALAIAVRSKCRIFIAEQVVEEAGVPVDLMTPARQESSPGSEGDSSAASGIEDLLGMDAVEGEVSGVGGADISDGIDVLGGQGLSGALGHPPSGGSVPGRSAGAMDDERRRLVAALEKAVADEDYEAAAVIRDKLRELEDEL